MLLKVWCALRFAAWGDEKVLHGVEHTLGKEEDVSSCFTVYHELIEMIVLCMRGRTAIECQHMVQTMVQTVQGDVVFAWDHV